MKKALLIMVLEEWADMLEVGGEENVKEEIERLINLLKNAKT